MQFQSLMKVGSSVKIIYVYSLFSWGTEIY